jgi:hypothetical protein
LQCSGIEMTSAFAIDVRGVTKKFGARTAVNDIAMQVRPGNAAGRGIYAASASEFKAGFVLNRPSLGVRELKRPEGRAP